MGQVIPEPLHENVSPLLLAAGDWPDPDSLRSIAKLREEAEEPDEIEVDRSEQSALADGIKLCHGALRNEPIAERIYWDDGEKLYYKLGYKPPEEPPKDGDKYEAWKKWSGWATFAPGDPDGPVFRLLARCEEPAESLDYEGLAGLWGAVLTNKLRDEVTRSEEVTSFFPGAEGPDHVAGITDLDTAGFGSAYQYMYSYTDGSEILLAFQMIPHATADSMGVRPR